MKHHPNGIPPFKKKWCPAKAGPLGACQASQQSQSQPSFTDVHPMRKKNDQTFHCAFVLPPNSKQNPQSVSFHSPSFWVTTQFLQNICL